LVFDFSSLSFLCVSVFTESVLSPKRAIQPDINALPGFQLSASATQTPSVTLGSLEVKKSDN
jgi:hypothetical protein